MEKMKERTVRTLRCFLTPNLDSLMKFQLDNSRAVPATRADVIGATDHERPLEVRSKFIAHSPIAFTRSCDTDYNQLPRYHGIRRLRLCPFSTRTIAQEVNKHNIQYKSLLRVFCIGVVI